MKPDILFIHPNASSDIFQDLSQHYSAIEPPIWAAMLANHVRTKGFQPELIDCEALNMNDDVAIYHVRNINPRMICFVVYGQQPSASSQNMEGAVRLADKIKECCDTPIIFVGGHVSALPLETMNKHDCIDFVCQNEGVYTISTLLQVTDLTNLDQLMQVPGLGFRYEDQIIMNKPASIVAKEDLAIQLPGMAWDLLPMQQYRTALWHSLSNNCDRQPFAAIYTSLGCPFKCSFCMINTPFGGSSFRYWEPEFIIGEFDKLAKMGITNIKIADEMFVMRPDHFMRLCELIIERGYKFNIWCYARVDITKPEYLATLKKAGVNWLALGIESGNMGVRKGVIKGRFDDVNIKKVVSDIRDAGINVIGNYIFGLPDDTMDTMQETLDMAMEMNTEEANFYSAMAYPGSQLYNFAVKDGTKLPDEYVGYSQHSYHTQPLPTKYLPAAQVLKFRDEAWLKYHTNPKYLQLMLDSFGQRAYNDTIQSTKITLKRKLLGD